ncbi:Peptide chain release factor [Dirofilaria immitis]
MLLIFAFWIVIGFFERPLFVFETASTATASTVDTRCGNGKRLDSFEARRAYCPEASKQAGNVVQGVGW